MSLQDLHDPIARTQRLLGVLRQYYVTTPKDDAEMLAHALADLRHITHGKQMAFRPLAERARDIWRHDQEQWRK